MTTYETFRQFKKIFPRETNISYEGDMIYLGEPKSQHLDVSLAFLLGRRETKVQLDGCREQDLPVLFLFQEVWWSDAWPWWFPLFVRSAGLVRPNVRVLKINNLKWLFSEEQVQTSLLDVFPNLEQVQYVDNVVNDEKEEIGSERYGDKLRMTSEQAKRALGKLADPFAW